jgi:hypothetical protein
LRHVFTPVALVLLTGVMAFSSVAAFAGEHYTEVWNPPEAQTSKAKGRSHNLVPVQARKKHKGGLTVKKIADRTTLAPPALSAAGPVASRGKSSKSPAPNMQLPPLIGPDGKVLRVSYPGV